MRRTNRLARLVLICVVLTAIVVLQPSNVRADGDDFFFDAHGMPRDTDLFYFGSVKDEEGRYISQARVRAVLTLPMDSGERKLTIDSVTNELGRYRTNNLANIILGLDLDLDPSIVALSVVKEGYREKRRDRRSKRDETRLIEMNFVMSKIPDTGEVKTPPITPGE